MHAIEVNRLNVECTASCPTPRSATAPTGPRRRPASTTVRGEHQRGQADEHHERRERPAGEHVREGREGDDHEGDHGRAHEAQRTGGGEGTPPR